MEGLGGVLTSLMFFFMMLCMSARSSLRRPVFDREFGLAYLAQGQNRDSITSGAAPGVAGSSLFALLLYCLIEFDECIGSGDGIDL